MIQLSFRVLVSVIVALSTMTACGGCGDPDESDTGVVDMGGDVAVDDDAPNSDPNNDPNNINPDADPADMGSPDLGPMDTDGDGLLDGDDNCPEVPNPEQLDRDRDGLGDECDLLPYIHDPSNPATVQTIREDEAMQPNNTAESGLAYGLELPFIARGVVGDAETVGDLDYYSFEVDAPTHVLMRLTAAPALWSGAVVLGMDLANLNVFRAEIGPDVGVSSDRELFLPFPGRYTVVMTDARNLIESQADVGGGGLQYVLSMTALPLPAPELLTLPAGPITSEYDGVMRVYEIDVDGVSGLRATSTGIAADENSFVIPALTLYDPDGDQGLAITSINQSAQTQVASVGIKLKERQRIWVIDDFSQHFGGTSTRIDVRSADLTKEPESPNAPADTRDADVPWLEVGEGMEAAIGPVRPGNVGDEDFFLFSARRGQTIRITVTPSSGSLIEPFVELAYFPDQVGFPIVIHEADVQGANQPAVVEYVITAYVDGELSAYVQHAPNRFSASPVGGLAYGYTVTVTEVQPPVSAIATVPGSTTVEFEPGRIGIASFSATAGQILTVSEDSALFTDMRIIDRSTWRVLASGNTALSFSPLADADYWVEIRDVIGRGTAGVPATISVAEVTPTPIGALPATAAGILNVEARQLHSFTGASGDRIDIRVYSPSFFAAVDLYDASFQPIGGRTYEDRQIVLPADGEYIVGVSSSGGTINDSYNYELGIAKIAPAPSALPLNVSAVYNNRPFARWFQIPVVTGTAYTSFIDAAEPQFAERITLFDEDLAFVRSSVSGTARWIADYTGSIWLAVEDDNNEGGPTFDYTMAFTELTTQSIAVALPTAGQLGSGSDEMLHTFNLAAGAMLDIEVVPTGDWRPSIRLVTGDTLTSLTEPTAVGGRLRYAVSTAGPFGVAVRSTNTALAGPLNYTVTLRLTEALGASFEVEPNNTLVEAQDPGALPVAMNGAIAAADLDRFRIPLIRGQRLWALTTDRNGFGVNRFDARLFLYDALDMLVTSNSFSGEGFMPAMYGYEVANSGEYQVAYGARAGGNANGDYTLYLATSAATQSAEAEPNNDVNTAQALGALNGVTRISATVDVLDPTDVFSLTITKSNARIRASLENAAPGHELRLLDSTGAQIVATGAVVAPAIDRTGLAAGTYYVELGAGTALGPVDLIVIAE